MIKQEQATTNNGDDSRKRFEEMWGKPISVYTRAQALADGTLVELTETGRQFGFKIPMACTSAVWQTLEWNDACAQRKGESTGQSTAGRLNDVLFMAALAARRASSEGVSTVIFPCLVVPSEGASIVPKQHTFHLTVSGGDDGEPVLTLMFPGED